MCATTMANSSVFIVEGANCISEEDQECYTECRAQGGTQTECEESCGCVSITEVGESYRNISFSFSVRTPIF